MAADALNWVRIADALKISGLSRRTLTRRVESGLVAREEHEGHYVYSVADLERVADSEQPTDAPSPEARMLAQAYRMIDLLIVPSRQLNEALSKELTALRERCAQLERTQVQLVLAREQALDRSAERELRSKRESREIDLDEAIRIEREEQRERGMRVITQLLPRIMSKLGKKDAAELAKAAAEAFDTDEESEVEQPTNGVNANVS